MTDSEQAAVSGATADGPRQYAVFLRGVSNVPMQPFRDALGSLGLADVRSFGSTGNLVFRAPSVDRPSIEASIAEAVGAEAFVRDRDELAAIVAEDPHAGREGAAVFLAKRQIAEEERDRLGAPGFEGDPPVVAGSTVYFVHPVRRPGHRGIIDFERELGVRGTMRSSSVVARVFEMMRS